MHTILFLLLFAGSTAATNPADPTALVKRSDASRNPWLSFVTKIRISNFETGKQDEAHDYIVYSKGSEKTYVEFMSPQEKGRHLLMLTDDMWIYLPDTSRPVRITPLERLSGNASNGDVARTNYAIDYDVAYLRRENAEGPGGTADCHVLELTAKRKGATYRKIHYWLRTDNGLPYKADFFVVSGKIIKSATFDEYQSAQGRVVLKRMTIYDQVRKNSRSVIDYVQFAPRDLPDKLFHQGRSGDF